MEISYVLELFRSRPNNVWAGLIKAIMVDAKQPLLSPELQTALLKSAPLLVMAANVQQRAAIFLPIVVQMAHLRYRAFGSLCALIRDTLTVEQVAHKLARPLL